MFRHEGESHNDITSTGSRGWRFHHSGRDRVHGHLDDGIDCQLEQEDSPAGANRTAGSVDPGSMFSCVRSDRLRLPRQWMILMCTPSDQPLGTVTPALSQSVIEHNPKAPTVHDYWWQLSDHAIHLTYSNVSTRWFATRKTLSQLQKESRDQKLQDCVDAAGTGGRFPRFVLRNSGPVQREFRRPGSSNARSRRRDGPVFFGLHSDRAKPLRA